MKKLFEGISLNGIVKPGEAYIFHDYQSDMYDPGPIGWMYLIRSDDDILQALEMELVIVKVDLYKTLKFLGYLKLSEDCYEFNVLCYEKEERKLVKYCQYLHRIKSFNEGLAQVKELWGIS